MKKIFILIFISIFIISCDKHYVIVDINKVTDECEYICDSLMSKAYFEGQRDAINGDIRIKLNSDSVYIWTKSCWNDGTIPLFQPSLYDTNN